MKRKICIIILCAALFLIWFMWTLCSNKPNDNTSTALRLDFLLSLELNDYDKFNSLLLNENTISKKKFSEIRSIYKDSSSVKEYQLLSFDKDNKLLIEFTYYNDEIKIKNITMIPKDMAYLFDE